MCSRQGSVARNQVWLRATSFRTPMFHISFEFERLGELISSVHKAFQDTRSLGAMFARCQESFCRPPARACHGTRVTVLPLRATSAFEGGPLGPLSLPGFGAPPLPPYPTSPLLKLFRSWAKQGSNLAPPASKERPLRA